MKKLFCIALLASLSTSILAQENIREAYFHELRGMEDSSGVTHLFYRQYVKSYYQCAPGDDKDIVENRRNHVHHFNTSNNADKVKFSDSFEEWCLAGMYDSQSVFDYDFYNNDPNKWISHNSFEYGTIIGDYLGNEINTHTPIIVKRNQSSDFDYGWIEEFYLSPNDDSLYTFLGKTIPFAGHGGLWPEFETHEEFVAYADSVSFDLKIIAIPPDIDSLYFAVDGGGNLYRSEHYSQNFTLADSVGYFRDLYFDEDSTHIYSLHNSSIGRSDNLGKADSWDFIDVNFTSNTPKFITIDKSVSGQLFLSDSTSILFSENYGDSFSELLSVEDEITGLYKKPDSDLLYVLTTEELLEVNVETKSTTSLKKIPVSNETESSEIPNQITLEQNYPNPFNPSTVISYQLTGNSLVRIEVFDITGRKVAVLVDGVPKTTGTHRVTFDASGLSSGVYFYRLETGGQTLTKKMMLVK